MTRIGHSHSKKDAQCPSWQDIHPFSSSRSSTLTPQYTTSPLPQVPYTMTATPQQTMTAGSTTPETRLSNMEVARSFGKNRCMNIYPQPSTPNGSHARTWRKPAYTQWDRIPWVNSDKTWTTTVSEVTKSDSARNVPDTAPAGQFTDSKQPFRRLSGRNPSPKRSCAAPIARS